MGMYTQLFLSVDFKRDADSRVVDIIRDMATPSQAIPTIDTRGLDHSLFKTERWSWMLNAGGSAYFDGAPFCNFREKESLCGSNRVSLTFCKDIKNYSGEWEEFLNFISPHLETVGFIGTYRYEEWDLPTLLIRDEDGTILWRRVI